MVHDEGSTRIRILGVVRGRRTGGVFMGTRSWGRVHGHGSVLISVPCGVVGLNNDEGFILILSWG